MKHARIVSGAYEDCWGPIDNLALPNGEPNWGALMRADPGLKKCPGCGCFCWNEGAVLECPDCKTQFGDGLPASAEEKP